MVPTCCNGGRARRAFRAGAPASRERFFGLAFDSSAASARSTALKRAHGPRPSNVRASGSSSEARSALVRASAGAPDASAAASRMRDASTRKCKICKVVALANGWPLVARLEHLAALEPALFVPCPGHPPQEVECQGLFVAERPVGHLDGDSDAAAGNQRKGPRRVRVESLVGRQVVGNLGDLKRAEPQAGAARTNGGQKRVGPRGDQQEGRGRRWLLQALQQRVLGLRAHLRRIVDDDNAPPPLERPERRLVQNHADLIDADLGLILVDQALDDDDVGEAPPVGLRSARRDPTARGAGAAGIDGEYAGGNRSRRRASNRRGARDRRGAGPIGRQAVEGLRDRDGGQSLADAGGAREDQARGERVARDGPADEAEHLPMADDLTKGHGPIVARRLRRRALHSSTIGGYAVPSAARPAS